MIGTVDVIVQAAKPDFPLSPFCAFVSSPSSVRVRNVPRRIGTWDITAVSVSVDYPDGTTETAACVLTAGVWVGTVPGCETPGDALRGFTIHADGIDENGNDVIGYLLGVGDVEILNRETALTPGVVTFKGDPGPQGERGPAGPQGPQGPKGDPGSGAVESVNNKTGAVVLGGDDIEVGGGGDTRAISGAIHDNETKVNQHIAARENPHGVTVDQIGAQKRLTAGENITITASGVISATGGSAVVESEDNPGFAANADFAERADSATSDGDGVQFATGYAKIGDLAVVLDLVGSRTSGSPYAIQLDGVVQTFAQVKEFAETRNSVIRHGRGTYRVTYVSASEMMWDCTGTVQGEVQTGQIHIFADGDVVQLVAAKELAAKSAVDAVSAMAAYPIETIVGGAVKDRTVNVCEGGGVITFPGMRIDGCVRDFVVRVPAMDTAPTVVFPSYVRYESWQASGDIWTAEAGKANEWYFSESEPGVFKVVHQALAVVAQ